MSKRPLESARRPAPFAGVGGSSRGVRFATGAASGWPGVTHGGGGGGGGGGLDRVISQRVAEQAAQSAAQELLLRALHEQVVAVSADSERTRAEVFNMVERMRNSSIPHEDNRHTDLCAIAAQFEKITEALAKCAVESGRRALAAAPDHGSAAVCEAVGTARADMEPFQSALARALQDDSYYPLPDDDGALPSGMSGVFERLQSRARAAAAQADAWVTHLIEEHKVSCSPRVRLRV